MVVCQNTTTGKWTVRGRIIKARTAEDGSVRTFEVKTESGSITLRNARFIRHQTKMKDVSWAVDDTRSDDAAEHENSSSPGSSSKRIRHVHLPLPQQGKQLVILLVLKFRRNEPWH